ncbi:MAG TPA: helical backbone metal receptor [bacterium]|nr:helical backbone metal receptor [bacterium]HQJ59594.1 helical backbone metal receptor [bacterium]HQN74239.1 helical backbone metal receptor [bacterium]HQO91709.1 helical backbone metal receptor [bacterium]
MIRVTIITIILVLFTGCKDKKVEDNSICKRIVSTAPSITSTLFELGLGDKIVGVTDNCKLPQDAVDIKRIGKVLDVSSEAVLSLKPDTAIVLSANESLAVKMNNLKINTIVVDQSTIEGFVFSLKIIGEVCSVQQSADDLNRSIEEKLNSVLSSFKPDKSLKIMVVAGRDYFDEGIKDVYIAGRDGFYEKIMEIIGVQNVYQGSLAYPKIQVEGIMTLDPDMIIDVVTMENISGEKLASIQKNWDKLKNIKAVKNGKVFVVNKDYWSIPGPGYVRIVEDFIEMIKK